jgi:hypothetical protein
VRVFGSTRNSAPGSLLPTGSKTPPDASAGKYARIEYLQGRVMAYRMNAMSHDVFSTDLFALAHVKCGLGEDTYLSRQVGLRGKMTMLLKSGFLHPDEVVPNSYPIKAHAYGFATAFSRRLLADTFRGRSRIIPSDYWKLITSYMGNIALLILRAAFKPRIHRWAFAIGYFKGACFGAVRPARAIYLSPGIDWWKDAEDCIARLAAVNNCNDPGDRIGADQNLRPTKDSE